MKILLDECLPVDFRHYLSGHEAHSAQWAGFKGKKNDELLRAPELAGYGILLTVDQGIPYQQPTSDRKLALIVIRSQTNQIEHLAPLTAAILKAVESVEAGQTVTVC